MPKLSIKSTIDRRKKEFANRKAFLLGIAEDVFTQKGYFFATADEIAEKAGVSVGTLYNLVESKERLYAAIAERIGEQILGFIRDKIAVCNDSEQAIEELIRFRLLNYQRQRLFFVLFSSEYGSGIYPDYGALSKNVFSIYYQYLNAVSRIFELGMEQGCFERMHPFHLAISFEGVINGFFNYWSRPEQSGEINQQIKNITHTFLQMIGLKPEAGNVRADVVHQNAQREVYISKFDYGRLKELLVVARGFGNPECVPYLDLLESALASAKIVEPRQVPPGVATMNSRVRLKNMDTGERITLTLVFPADVTREKDELSVLTPLGTALLGCNAGGVVALPGDKGSRYLLEAILYQPESAGDFHL